LPAIIVSVARRMPSTSDSLQPYLLSNFDLVTLSFTLIAGKGRCPFSMHLVEAMHAGGGFLGHALDHVRCLEPAGAFGHALS
jgi:hypothetical protein